MLLEADAVEGPHKGFPLTEATSKTQEPADADDHEVRHSQFFSRLMLPVLTSSIIQSVVNREIFSGQSSRETRPGVENGTER
jgi:hypothetical protein